jgi:hypothetical protein
MLVLTSPVAKPEANLGYACLSAFLVEIVGLVFATSSCIFIFCHCRSQSRFLAFFSFKLFYFRPMKPNFQRMGQLLGAGRGGVGEGGEEKEKELPPTPSSSASVPVTGRGRGRGGRGSRGPRGPRGAGARGGPPTKVFTPGSYPLKV